MVLSTIHNSLLGQSFQSIQIHFEKGIKQYCLIELKKYKNALNIIKRFSTSEFEELQTIISKNKPVLLSFTGQGIISKKVNKELDYRTKMLFNSDPQEFYWNEFQQYNDIFISVARKEVINKEISLFTDLKYAVISFNLGPFITVVSKPLLDSSEIRTKDFVLNFKNSDLTDFQKQTENNISEYEMGDETISQNEIIPFASVLHFLFPDKRIVLENDDLTNNQTEFLYKKAFNYLGAFILGLFLLSLLVSYVLLSHYQDENSEVLVSLGQQNMTYSKLISLEKDKENKEAILRESGLSDSNFLSFYVSEITKYIPQEVNLTVLTIFPATKKIKESQRIQFKHNQIDIEGVVLSYSVFSNWIKELKNQSWVDTIEIIDYHKNNRLNNFKIRILVKFNV